MIANPGYTVRQGRLLFLLVCSMAPLPGCACFTWSKAEAKRQGPHPILAAARANRINMFGDLGIEREAGYFTRSAVSLRQHTFSEVGTDNDVDLDPTSGRMVFSSTRHNLNPDLYIKSVDGVAVTQLTSDPASDVQPEFSPDGSKVAFASNRGGQWGVWIIDVNGGQPARLTESTAEEAHPSWSPDGSELVFCSLPEQGGQWELWIADARAGGSRRFIGYGLFPEWSPNGAQILYQRARERGSRWFSIWTMQLVNGEPRYPTEMASNSHSALTLPTWSPDGGSIAFSSITEWPSDISDQTGISKTYDVWVMNADGRRKVRLTDGYTLNYAPGFSADGRVYFTSNRSGHENIWSLMPTGQGTEPWNPDSLTERAPQTTQAPGFHDELAARPAAVREGF